MTEKQSKVKCVECGKKAAEGVLDCYARFWCEECLIFVLGNLTPATEKRGKGKQEW